MSLDIAVRCEILFTSSGKHASDCIRFRIKVPGGTRT